MAENTTKQIHQYGQSLWLDFISRGIIRSGKLKKLIEQDGIRGVTSNPSIFEKAIAETDDYQEAIEELASQGKSVEEMYQILTVQDIQAALDLFRPMYDKTDGGDGFVSLEVSPHLAHDTEGTVSQARELWSAVDRPNLMIKVPGTREGLPAIRQLISEGVNVNVTLLFGLPRYREVFDAYMSGMEDRVKRGEPVDGIASVASFFLSRIDVLVDPMLKSLVESGKSGAEAARKAYRRTAIASARIAYQIFLEVKAGDRYQALASKGMAPQRLLWASTSTKNDEESDIKYVEALIGPETVNTVPLKTLEAYRDHGEPKPRLEEEVDEARDVLEHLLDAGITIDDVTQKLEDEGVEKFNRPYDKLMETLKREREAALTR